MRDWSLAAACSRQEIVRREVETQVALVSTIMPATDCCPSHEVRNEVVRRISGRK